MFHWGLEVEVVKDQRVVRFIPRLTILADKISSFKECREPSCLLHSIPILAESVVLALSPESTLAKSIVSYCRARSNRSNEALIRDPLLPSCLLHSIPILAELGHGGFQPSWLHSIRPRFWRNHNFEASEGKI